MVGQELFINALLIKRGRRGLLRENIFDMKSFRSFCYLNNSQPLLHSPTNKVSFVSTFKRNNSIHL